MGLTAGPDRAAASRAEASKPAILMTAPMPSEAPFDAKFAVHRLWQAADAAKLFDTVGGDIVGIAAGGRIRIDEPLLRRLPNVKVIANFGVGYERIDVDAALARGITVTNTPDVLTDEVADLTLGLLIATVREIPRAERFLRDGLWPNGRFPLTASLRGRKVGIIGLGRIGKAVAVRCAAFGLTVAYFGRKVQADQGYRYFDDLKAMAEHCDVLIATLPGGDATQNIVDRAVLDRLGPQGIFINVSRGSIVDEAALIAALREKRILAAGLDVYRNEPAVPPELLALDNVVLLPHVGSGSRATFAAMNDLLLRNLEACLGGLPPVTPIPEMADGRPRRRVEP